MNYELAQKLKDAGFPHIHLSEQPEKYGNNAVTSCPSLSELIEACGDDFISIEKEEKGWEACAKYFCCEEHGEGRKFGNGSTPDIAVANLWLALNKK